MNFCDSERPRGLYEEEGNIRTLKATYVTTKAEVLNMNARWNLRKILRKNEEPSSDFILGFAS